MTPTLTFRHLAQFYDVPHFNVDIPFESSPQAVDYVAGQLRQMGEFLTRQTGLPLDDGQLARTVAPRAEFLNLEEDLGLPGLRENKLSYQPCALLARYQATLAGGAAPCSV